MWSVCFKRAFATSKIVYRRGIRNREIAFNKTEFPTSDVKYDTGPYKLESPLLDDTLGSLDKLKKNTKKVLNDRIVSDLDANDKLFSKIVFQLGKKKQRLQKQIVILEGTDLIQTALSHGAELEYIFYSKDEALRCLDTSGLCANKILKVKDRNIRKLSGNRDSHHVVATCSIPSIKPNSLATLPVTILCNNIRDPDNLGAVISLGAATGCKSILLTEGCADVWEHKVMNAAGGAHFYIPIVNKIKWSEVCNCIPSNCALYIADSSTDITLEENYDDAPSNIDEDVSCLDFLKSNKSDIPVLLDKSVTPLQTHENSEMPCHLYCGIDFPKKDILLIMGGETHGIDKNIEQLGLQLGAEKVRIPLENGMDSLNVSAALSIILFEIKRQFKKHLMNVQ